MLKQFSYKIDNQKKTIPNALTNKKAKKVIKNAHNYLLLYYTNIIKQYLCQMIFFFKA